MPVAPIAFQEELTQDSPQLSGEVHDSYLHVQLISLSRPPPHTIHDNRGDLSEKRTIHISYKVIPKSIVKRVQWMPNYLAKECIGSIDDIILEQRLTRNPMFE